MKILSPGSAYAPGQTPYDIFKDRMTAIGSIADGIKNIIANKYINKQLNMIADNILNEVDEQKSTDLINLIYEEPPDSIYPANPNIEETISQFVDYASMSPQMGKEVMMGNLPPPELGLGPMAQKETMMGGLPSVGGLPAMGGVTPTPAPTAETMIPKFDMYQLYNAIKSMPSGQVNWANLMKTMTEKKPYFMGATGPEEFVLNQMLGQVTDPRAKMIGDINLAKLVQETFYPEEEVVKPTEWDKKLDLFLQTNPTVDEVKEFVGGRIAPEKLSDFETKWNLLMQRDHTVEEEKKLIGASVTPEGKIDIKDIFENIPEGFELSSFNRSTAGTTSFSFKPIDTTTPWEFNTWDEAQEFLRTHPQEGFIGKIETNKQGFDVTWSQKGTTDELKAITPSDIKSFSTMLYGDEEFPGVITPEDYAKVKDYIIRSKKNFPIPEYLEIAEMNVSKCLGNDDSILPIDGNMDKGFLLYKYFYEFYKVALKGEAPKYLPPEAIPKTGIWKNKYGSALADDYELDFEAMEKDNVTEEDVWKKLQEIGERH